MVEKSFIWMVELYNLNESRCPKVYFDSPPDICAIRDMKLRYASCGVIVSVRMATHWHIMEEIYG